MIQFDNVVLKELITATENSFRMLFRNNKEKFYYCSLIMSEVSVPYISAWSEEALERLMLEKKVKENDFETKNQIYRWSYADSPYCAYGFDDFFQNVDKLFQKRFNAFLSDEAYQIECQLWINSMEETMRILDNKGIFGIGEVRNNVLINAEIMPPDDSNIDRAERLNPKIIFDKWLEDTQQIEVIELDYDSIWHPKLCNVILTEKILDKKMMLKLKNIFYYNGELRAFIEGCKKPPFIIKENALYDSASEVLKLNHEFKKFVKIEINNS